MALNPPLTLHGQPLRLENEYVLAQRPGVSFRLEVPAMPKTKSLGTLFLTSARLVFVSHDFARGGFKAFDMPLAHLFDISFRRPLFGAKQLEFGCRPLAGRLPGDARVLLRFMQGGTGRFRKMFEEVMAQLRQARQEAVAQTPFARAAGARPSSGLIESALQQLSEAANSVRGSLRNIRGIGQSQLQQTAAQLAEQARQTEQQVRQRLVEVGNYVRERVANGAWKAADDPTDPTLVVTQQPPLFNEQTAFIGHNIYRASDGAPASGSYLAAAPNDYRLSVGSQPQGSFYPVFDAGPGAETAAPPRAHSLPSLSSTPDAGVYFRLSELPAVHG